MLIRESFTNVDKNISKYVLIVIFWLVTIVFIDFIIAIGLTAHKRSKENNFIQLNRDIVSNLLLDDLQSVFRDKNLLILKKLPLSQNPAKELIWVSGTILELNQLAKSYKLDLQPLIGLTNYLLNDSFYYQFKLNSNVLASNFAHTVVVGDGSDYTVVPDIILSVIVVPKLDSPIFLSYQQELFQNIRMVIIGSVLFFSITLPLVLYATKKYLVSRFTTNELRLFKKYMLNSIDSIKDIEGFYDIPTALTGNSNKVLEVHKLAASMKEYAAGYVSHYKFQLQLSITSPVTSINFNNPNINIQQVLISILANLLYFMRGVGHVKKLEVYITQEQIVFTYEAFAANIHDMMNLSRNLFLHTGSVYILDFGKIFELLDKYDFQYEVKPNPGCNIVLVNLLTDLSPKKTSNNVINFNDIKNQ
jgi:hypothetical protein